MCAYTTYTQFPAHTYMYTITAHLHHGHIYMLCHAGYHGRFAASPPLTGRHRIPATGTTVTVISRHRRRHRRLHRCRRSCRRRSCRRRCRSQLRFDPQQKLSSLASCVEHLFRFALLLLHSLLFVVAMASASRTAYPSVYDDADFKQERAAVAARSGASTNLCIVSPDNCDLLDGVQTLVDELWRTHGEAIAGEKGYKAVRLQAVRDSHPEFPIFASILGSMPSLGNGHIPPCYVHRAATRVSHMCMACCVGMIATLRRDCTCLYWRGCMHGFI